MNNPFDYQEYLRRAATKASIDADLRDCSKCAGLNHPQVSESAPGFGNLLAKTMVVGQSLCTMCMHTQIPFTRGSGDMIDEALGMYNLNRLMHVFITNVVHCHPPKNRQSKPEEITNCQEYLVREINLVQPSLIIALGVDARNSLKKLGARFCAAEQRIMHTGIILDRSGKTPEWRTKTVWFNHPAYFLYKPDEQAQAKWKTNFGKLVYENQ